ncbi:MAG: hypothetical protein IPQ07_30265 [Myxococcales bacterium]|nr:hypothetical protein [Myxococcales bacterium]
MVIPKSTYVMGAVVAGLFGLAIVKTVSTKSGHHSIKDDAEDSDSDSDDDDGIESDARPRETSPSTSAARPSAPPRRPRPSTRCPSC